MAWEHKGRQGLASRRNLPARGPTVPHSPGCRLCTRGVRGQRPVLPASALLNSPRPASGKVREPLASTLVRLPGGGAGRGEAGCITALAPPPLLLPSGLGGGPRSPPTQVPGRGAGTGRGSQFLCCPLPTPSRRFLRFQGSASASVSPEEQRVLERKLKKERKKEARRRLREAGIAVASSPASKRSGAALALEYLCR